MRVLNDASDDGAMGLAYDDGGTRGAGTNGCGWGLFPGLTPPNSKSSGERGDEEESEVAERGSERESGEGKGDDEGKGDGDVLPGLEDGVMTVVKWRGGEEGDEGGGKGSGLGWDGWWEREYDTNDRERGGADGTMTQDGRG